MAASDFHHIQFQYLITNAFIENFEQVTSYFLRGRGVEVSFRMQKNDLFCSLIFLLTNLLLD